MTYTYSAFGLIFHLPFPCPSLPEAPADSQADVVVRYGDVPRSLHAPLATEDRWALDEEQFLYRAGRRAGRFLVQSAGLITVDRSPEATDESLCFFLLDLVLAMLLEQRGWVVLHASAVVTPLGAVAVSGVSGAGKSTLLAALVARGCAMLSDDITAISLASGAPLVLPGVPEYNLCDDAAGKLGQSVDGLLRPRWRRSKVIVPAARRLASEPSRLRALYCLKVEDADNLTVTSLEGWQKFDLIRQQRYGITLPTQQALHLAQLAQIAAQTEAFSIVRPRRRWTVDTLADLILSAEGSAASQGGAFAS